MVEAIPENLLVEFRSSAISVVPYHLSSHGSHMLEAYRAMFCALPPQVNEVVEYSTGNAAIAAATLANEFSIRTTLFLPDTASQRKREILHSLGAKVILTPAHAALAGARQAALEYAEASPRRFLLDQLHHPGAARGHYERAPRLADSDAFVSVAGSYATLRGYGSYLKALHGELFPVIALELDCATRLATPLVTHDDHHQLEGIGLNLDSSHTAAAAIDIVATISPKQVEAVFCAALASQLNVGPSGALNLAVAAHIAAQLPWRVVGTVTFDSLERYDFPLQPQLYRFSREAILAFFGHPALANLTIAFEDISARVAEAELLVPDRAPSQALA